MIDLHLGGGHPRSGSRMGHCLKGFHVCVPDPRCFDCRGSEMKSLVLDRLQVSPSWLEVRSIDLDSDSTYRNEGSLDLSMFRKMSI